MTTRIGWGLRAQVHGDPLLLARQRLLFDWVDPLDDEAELFLSSLVEQMSGIDLLAWLARRGSETRELPTDALPSSRIAKRFLTIWKPEDGFRMLDLGEGLTHEGVAIHAIDSDVWAEIAEEMLRHLGSTTNDETQKRIEWVLLRSLRGCELYEALRKQSQFPWPPECVRTEHSTAIWHGVMLALVPVRRDAKACERVLIDRARKGRESGDLTPLWVLEQLRLLERVDPREVLPPRTTFPFHREAETRATESGFTVPCGEFPVALALRWPGAARPLAEAWLRELLLQQNTSELPERFFARYLFGGADSWFDSPARTAIRTWLRSRSAFDELMRASLDAGRPLPFVWITVVRDLRAQADGAWARALSWFELAMHELCEREKTLGASLPTAPVYFDLEPELLEWLSSLDGGHDSRSALYWIALEAPTGSDLDEELATRIEAAIQRLVAWRSSSGERTRHPLFDAWSKAVWHRIAALPRTESRRARLLSMLKEQPGLVQVASVREVVEELIPLTAAEVPPFAFTLLDDTEDLRSLFAWYARFGGESYLAEMRASFDRLRSDAHGFDSRAFALLEICSADADESWRSEVLAFFVAQPLSWLIHEKEAVESSLGVTIDLLSIARDRLHGAEPFTVLPSDPAFESLLVERLEHLAASKRCTSRRRSDCEALELARRLRPETLASDRVRRALATQLHVEQERDALAMLDLLEQVETPRTELIEIALTCIARSETAEAFLSTNDAVFWLAKHLLTRSAWEREGGTVVSALLDSTPGALVRLAAHTVYLARNPEDPKKQQVLCDAILLQHARVFAARAATALEGGEWSSAKTDLLALMELDAPSFAMRFIRPLRKYRDSNEEIASVLSACDQQLRHDTGRISSADNVSRAIGVLLRRTAHSAASAAD